MRIKRLTIRPFESPRPLLNWVLRRGRETLAFQVRRAGERYQVSVLPRGLEMGRKNIRPYVTLLSGANAFRLHAALVAGFRDAGWTSVAYR
jgi:hypothetical protein